KDGIRDFHVTGVQTCALPILTSILRDQETLNIFNIAPLLNLNLEESRDLDAMLQLLYKEIYDQNPYQSYYESIFKTILLKIIKLSDANTTLQRNQEIAIAFKQLVYLGFFKEKSVTRSEERRVGKECRDGCSDEY